MPFTRYVILILALTVLGGSAAVAQTDYREQIAATVNDDVITTTDIKTRLRLNTGGQPIPESEQPRAFNVILDELITEALQKQEARALSINVEREQLDEAFETVARQNEVSAEEFSTRMQQAGVPPEALYKKLETEIAWSQVVRRKLRPQITISESDIDAVFEDIERSAAEPQFRLAEIFLKKGTGDAENRMKALRQKIVSGEMPFPEAAQKHSEASGASRGGDLGWMSRAQMAPHLQPVVDEIQKGQMSPLIESDAGYHLVLLIDSRDAKAADRENAPSKTDEAARERIANQLGMQRMEALQNRYLQDLRAAAYIDRRI